MSRQSSMIDSRMWLNGTVQEILYEHSKDTFTVAVYLMTTPHAHMCGVYYLPFSEIGEHCNLSAAEVARCIGELESLGFCKYVGIPHRELLPDAGASQAESRTDSQMETVGEVQ